MELRSTKDTRSVEGRWHGDSSGSDNRGRWLLWDCDTRTCRDSRTEHSSPVEHRKFYFCRLWQSVIDNCRVSIVSGQLIPLYKWYDRIIFIIYSILIINILFDKTTTSVILWHRYPQGEVDGKNWNERFTEVMYLLTEISMCIYLVWEKLHKADRQISFENLSLIWHWKKNFIRWGQTWVSRFLSWVLSSNNSAEVNRMVFRVWTILQAKPTSPSSTMIWENDLKMSSAVRSWHNCLQIRSKELKRLSFW